MEDQTRSLTFSAIDYAFFCTMLGVSIGIGIYYGCFGSKQSTTKDYLFGGKSMRSFPIAMSLVASHLSGITLLGMPAEVYFHGTQLWMCVITMVMVALIIFYIFIPVFFKLQLDSTYEYLKIRFDHRVRTLASLLFVISTWLYVPIVIYLPSLAFNQVTGISVSAIGPIICVVCIFYTSIGGLRAVVLSDALQFSVTAITMLIVVFSGIFYAGGFSAVWQKAQEGDRLEFFNMNLNPTERTTLWGILFGMGATWVSNLGLNPSSIQRFQAMPDLNTVKRSVIYFSLGTILTKTVCCFTGLLMYHKYFDCDPLTAKLIKRSDQMLLYYVLDLVGHIPGLPGLFVAGVFCTALSTMSTCINTLSGTIYRDFMASRMPKDTSESTVNLIMKVIVVIIGVICLGLVFVVEKLGGVLELSLSFHGITAGPLFGLFVLGMLFPSANSKGALWGGIVSTVLEMFLVFGKQMFVVKNALGVKNKPVSVENCGKFNLAHLIDFNVTSTAMPDVSESDKPWLIFKISFYYYSLIGMLLVVLIGLPVSWLTKPDRPVDPDLLSPCLDWFSSKDKKCDTNCRDYYSIPTALEKVKGGGEKQEKTHK